jgi:hypothetical protein
MSYINRDFSAGLDEQNERRTKRTKRTLEAQGTKKREKRQNWSQIATGSKR